MLTLAANDSAPNKKETFDLMMHSTHLFTVIWSQTLWLWIM